MLSRMHSIVMPTHSGYTIICFSLSISLLWLAWFVIINYYHDDYYSLFLIAKFNQNTITWLTWLRVTQMIKLLGHIIGKNDLLRILGLNDKMTASGEYYDWMIPGIGMFSSLNFNDKKVELRRKWHTFCLWNSLKPAHLKGHTKNRRLL